MFEVGIFIGRYYFTTLYFKFCLLSKTMLCWNSFIIKGLVVTEQPMSSPDNIHARLRSIARARAATVHVRGASEHRPGTAFGIPAHCGCASDPRPH